MGEVRFNQQEMDRICQTLTWSASKIPEVWGYKLTIDNICQALLMPGWSINSHAHSFYEADIILYGHGLARGQEVYPDTVMVHEPYITHAWEVPDIPCQCFTFDFRIEPVIRLPHPDQYPWPRFPGMVDRVMAILEEAYQQNPGWKYRVTWKMGSILGEILSYGIWPEDESLPMGEGPDKLALVDQFLRDNISADIDLDDIAAHLRISRSTLTRLARRWGGGSIMERFFYHRMAKATELLIKSDKSISDIATYIGFHDPSYFIRRFKEVYRMTPHHYRLHMRIE